MDAQLDKTDTSLAIDTKSRHSLESVLPLFIDRTSSEGPATATGDVLTVMTRSPESAASLAPSSMSLKEQWQPKRHVCERSDCGKSFDSKWALIRCVFALYCGCCRKSQEEEEEATGFLMCTAATCKTHSSSHGREAVPMHVSVVRQVVCREICDDAVRC